MDLTQKKSSSKTKQGDRRHTSIDIDKIVTKNKKIIINQTMFPKKSTDPIDDDP